MKFSMKVLDSHNIDTVLNGIERAMSDTNRNAWGIACLMMRALEIDKKHVSTICERFDFKRATVYAYAKAFEIANEIEANMEEWTISKFAVLTSLGGEVIKEALEEGTINSEMTQKELKEFVQGMKAIESKDEELNEVEAEAEDSSEAEQTDEVLSEVIVCGTSYMVTVEQLEAIRNIILGK